MYDIPIFQLYISWIYGPGILFVWEIRTRNSIFPGDMDPEFHLFGTYGPGILLFQEIWTRNSIFAGDRTRNSICPRDMDWEVYFPGDINLILGTGQNLRGTRGGFLEFYSGV